MKVKELIKILEDKDGDGDVCMEFGDDPKVYDLCTCGDPNKEGGFRLYVRSSDDD